MSDEKALLAAIWEHPHDDTVRLAYADWLQETGEPANVARAEFIRVQIEHARYLTGDPQAQDLWSRQYHLHLKHSKIWRQVLPACLKRADFHRGFSYPRRTVRAAQLISILPAEWASAPVWDIRLSQQSRSAIQGVLGCSGLVRIGRLDTSSAGARNRSIHPDDAVQLVRTPELRNLANLSLSFSPLGPAFVRALCEHDSLPALTHLSLYGCRIGAEGVDILAASPLAERLESLTVNSNGLTADDLQPLFAALPRFSRLRRLGVGWNAEPDAIVRMLVAYTLPPALEALDVGGGALTDECVILVANWTEAAKLTQLDVRRYPGGFGAAVVRALVESPYLIKARRLTCPLGREDRDALTAALQARFGFHVSVD